MIIQDSEDLVAFARKYGVNVRFNVKDEVPEAHVQCCICGAWKPPGERITKKGTHHYVFVAACSDECFAAMTAKYGTVVRPGNNDRAFSRKYKNLVKAFAEEMDRSHRRESARAEAREYAAQQQRRAKAESIGYRQRAQDAGERISYREVFTRDRYVCHICGHATEKGTYHPHYAAPTLDHIVPLRHGGTHTMDNVACAHSTCNAMKNATPLTPQLRRHITEAYERKVKTAVRVA